MFLQLVTDKVTHYSVEMVGDTRMDIESKKRKLGKYKYHKGHRMKVSLLFYGVERTAEKRKLLLL